MIYELTLNEHDYHQYKAVEELFRSSDIYNRIFIAAKEDKNLIVVSCNELEGRGFNFRGFLIANGFSISDARNKRVMISW